MDLHEFRREAAKLAFRDRGLIGDCFAPKMAWPQVRQRLHAMLTNVPGFIQHFPNTGGYMQAQGYALKLSQWSFLAEIPIEQGPSPEHPHATGMPQVIITKPRNPAECELVYGLMEANKLVLQMCKPTGNAKVLPANVEPEALYERDLDAGAKTTLKGTAEGCVQVKSPGDLHRLLKDPTAWPRLRR